MDPASILINVQDRQENSVPPNYLPQMCVTNEHLCAHEISEIPDYGWEVPFFHVNQGSKIHSTRNLTIAPIKSAILIKEQSQKLAATPIFYSRSGIRIEITPSEGVVGDLMARLRGYCKMASDFPQPQEIEK